MAQNSGTIFMVTDKNIMSQILLMDGKIIDIQYLSTRGMEALSLIFRTVKFAMFYFVKRDTTAIKPKVDNSLPSLVHILEIMNTAVQGIDSNNEEDGKIGNDKGELINVDIAKIIKTITTELTMHLGPIAPMVCEEYFEDVKNLSEIMISLDKVASEIGNTAKEIEFKQIVTEKIKRM
jgi:hypothetical protein